MGRVTSFFANLLPPLRYVNAQFKVYPFVLCAPGSLQKARLIANGNSAYQCSWRPSIPGGTSAFPRCFFVGKDEPRLLVKARGILRGRL